MSDTSITYGKYLRVPELLELQKTASEPAHHDETLFIIIHQVYELWFKLILHEIETAVDHLWADRVVEATRLLRRVSEVQRVLVEQVRVLETMRPQDFLGFRYHLNPASGFQSIQFREVEFVLGLKDPELLGRLVCEPEDVERLRRRLSAPSLSDVVDSLLIRRGFQQEAPAVPVPESEDRRPHGRTREEDWRLKAFVAVYQGEDQHADLNALCEVMVDIDENLSLWRAHHVQMVERMIGFKRGTGGSEGVGYLQSTMAKRAFPDLWRARTYLVS
jgi:tryptophan 2,3-dioxygenase